MVSCNRKHDVTEYFLIVALYYVTGSAFSYTNYSLQITFFFLVSLGICVYRGKYQYILRERPFKAWFLMSFFIILVPLMQADSLATYIAIIMQISIGMFCAAIISIDNFKDKYIKVITFFAGVSIVFFTVGLVAPNIVYYFPQTIGSASVDYYNAGIYVFMSSKGYGSLVLTSRNSGICWEPGCYQMFLNLGLLFLLEKEQKLKQNHFSIYFIVLVTTIITTVSTTGIFIMIVLLLTYFRVWIKRLKNKWILLPVAVCMITFIANNSGLVEGLFSKLTREFGDSLGFIDRLSLNKLPYIFFPDRGFPYFFGMSFQTWVEHNQSLWNSVIHSFLCLGIPFTLIHLRGYWLGSKVMAKKSLLLFFVMILSASTETLFWRVFFNTITFYGWIYYPPRSSYGVNDK